MSSHEIYEAQVLTMQLLNEPHKSADVVKWVRVHDAVADSEQKETSNSPPLPSDKLRLFSSENGRES
jgi:hypothetical protein